MRVLIIDDEYDACINLKVFLEKHCPEITVVGTANDIKEGATLINDENPDLIFLDIQMPGGTGFQLLEQFKERSFYVVFVTSYHEYAVKAIKTSALDYLLKPIDIKELKLTVERALTRQSRKVSEQLKQFEREQSFGERQQIAVKTLKGVEMLSLNNIVCCESDSRYVYFHTVNRSKIMVCQNLKQIQELLEKKGFLRVHHSFVMNIKHIREYRNHSKLGKGGVLISHNGMEVPVSVRRKKSVMNYIVQYAINN